MKPGDIVTDEKGARAVKLTEEPYKWFDDKWICKGYNYSRKHGRFHTTERRWVFKTKPRIQRKLPTSYQHKEPTFKGTKK